MRKRWIGGNWKMHKTMGEAVELVRALKAGLPKGNAVEVVVAPPFTALQAVGLELQGSPVELAGPEYALGRPGGLHRGNFSGHAAGPGLPLCPHRPFRTTPMVPGDGEPSSARKSGPAWRHGLEPVLCVGETLEEREAGRVEEVLSRQIREGLQGCTREEAAQGVIAYEPVWAIGTGRTATPETAQEVHALYPEPAVRQFTTKTLHPKSELCMVAA